MGEATAKRINGYLFAQGITLYRLAKNAGVPVATLQNLYRGGTKNPTLSLVFKVCQGLGVSVTEFLSDPLFSENNLDLD